MKTKTLLSLCLALFLFGSSYAAETEPNNTKSQANTLSPTGSQTGAISSSTDVDWFKVTTTSDGRLDLTLTSNNGFYAVATLYDNDGVTSLNNTTTAGTGTFSTDGLAAGTYYVRITTYYTNQLPTYKIASAFVTAPVANDAEPDSTRATALALPLNSSTTGHINYYYNNHRDTLDFYKVTTNSDGLLQLKLTSNNGSYVTANLYDNNGTILLGTLTTAGTDYLNTDGLATGTYYVRINSYYNNQFQPYTLTDSLFKPALANDAEPNNTIATALTLAQNSTKTGHIDYYYNNKRDTFDFYKVTTDGDGLLQLKLKSGNGSYVSAYLYDNDGVTQLGTLTTAGTDYLNTDALAAGTYYIRVNSYYNNQFEPYSLTDSLFKPAQANDAEPDSTRATALTLPLNSSTTGHINYYYNNHRDTLDFYKVTTNSDGLLQLKLTSHSGTYVSAYLYDNNATTLLGTLTTSGTDYLNTDALAAGTYYVQINSYYNNQFAPYTLTDSLFKYSFGADAEPNAKPYQARTLLSNKSNTGHIGFYYKLQRDSLDWHKINYTGTSGTMKLIYNLQPHISDGGITNVTFKVYKDTAAAPISDVTFASSTTSVNLTSLTQGYYYISVNSYYNNQFESYAIVDSFTQVSKASISVVARDTAAACDNSNSITFKCSGNKAPYTVQLYRYGVAYGSSITVPNTSSFVVPNLPQGSYFARAFADGATGTAYGQSAVVNLVPQATATSVTDITGTSAKTNWSALTCVKYFTVQYHKAGTAAWTTQSTNGNVNSLTLTGLSPNTTYQWRVQAADSANGITALGAFSDSLSFTTTSGSTTLPVTLEAEDAVLSGPAVASNQPGYTGTGFADYANASGDYVEWTYNAATAGSYSLKFRYALGGSSGRPLQLTVNGTVVNSALPFAPTGSFSTWSTSSATANLVAGVNKIRLTTTGSNGPNMDNVMIDYSVTLPATLEAEDAVLNGPAVASNQPGYTGTGFADYANASGDYVEWTFNAASAGTYSLQFRYALGGSSGRPLQLTVNGTVINASLPFAPTGSFSTWSNSSATASLVAGTNKIRLTSIGSNGPNVDHLVIDQTAPPTTLEAEDAVLSGPAVASNQPGYTGTGFADYANASGDYVEWTYNAATAGSYSLNFRYALGGSGGRPLQLTVNGTVINASLPFAPTGSFSTWSTSSATANLVAGVNKIRLTTIGSNGPNMDNVVIEKNNLRSIQYIQRSMPERNVLSTGSDLLKASILPNPVVSNNAKLIVSTSSNLPISFQLVDMLGRSYGSPGLMKSGSNTVDLSVHGLPAGSYIVVIKQGAQTTQARLVIGAY